MTGHNRKTTFKKKVFKELVLVVISLSILFATTMAMWLSGLDLPDFNNFENRNISNSTKIYDRTGNVVLYSLNDNIKRTSVNIDQINKYIQEATIAIEDAHFYEHNGFRPTSFIRALFANIQKGGFSQGGSTIDQQVIKNSLLTREKTITRKIKEILLAIKLDKTLDKKTILQIYLNESPYGGTLYGVEEASLIYFNKKAKDISLTEAAYIASLPQSPTYFSPFGKHRDDLEKRKNLVLEKMYELGYISEQQKQSSQNEYINFERDETNSGKALHFVMYTKEYLEEKYGDDTVRNGGLKVITTLDFEIQKQLEEIVKISALENAEKQGASNSGLVMIDPKTGQILSMVGSRDFFDTKIQGQYNITTALRQPGSAIKPIVYAAAFEKGFTPETVLFDSQTQFDLRCDAYGKPYSGADASVCYMPGNYDDKFRGPVSLRNALAQSLNVPAVKLLYLTGIKNVVELAQKMGISTINDPNRYGLPLVLGGGEVSLLELTNAYGVFANNGDYNKPVGILEIRDHNGDLLEKYTQDQKNVLPETVSSLVSSVLSDNQAKAPVYGVNSPLFFKDRPVASKTGTTNDYKDVWVVGYTPSLVLGMWAGNNDNTPINKKTAGVVLSPVWKKAMLAVLKDKPIEYFPDPLPNTSNKSILQGVWCSDDGAHSILKYVDKENVLGDSPSNPSSDPQYNPWETSVQNWLSENNNPCPVKN